MHKHLLSLSLTVVIILFDMTAAAFADFYVCGDADASGQVDIDDAVYIINYIFASGPEPHPYESGDADASGEVDIDDVVYIINHIFAGGPPPLCSCGLVTDIDGNVYTTVRIGDQCWMKENLRVTHYRNGDSIPNVTGGAEWENLSTGAYCEYDNDLSYAGVYGRLYNWYAVDDSRGIAPDGWHVPTDDDWKQMETYLGMSKAEADSTGWRGTDEGGKIKEAGTTHWSPPNTGATNESGLTALPGGYRLGAGIFDLIGYYTLFWSSTEGTSDRAWYRYLSCFNSRVLRGQHDKRDGFSVRCVRD